MCPFASNVIGSRPAPLRATLFKKKSKDIFRTLFFCMRSQKGTFKPFPTNWYTLSLFQSMYAENGGVSAAADQMAGMQKLGFLELFRSLPCVPFRAMPRGVVRSSPRKAPTSYAA